MSKSADADIDNYEDRLTAAKRLEKQAQRTMLEWADCWMDAREVRRNIEAERPARRYEILGEEPF